jgi:hypothetical protein
MGRVRVLLHVRTFLLVAQLCAIGLCVKRDDRRLSANCLRGRADVQLGRWAIGAVSMFIVTHGDKHQEGQVRAVPHAERVIAAQSKSPAQRRAVRAHTWPP